MFFKFINNSKFSKLHKKYTDNKITSSFFTFLFFDAKAEKTIPNDKIAKGKSRKKLQVLLKFKWKRELKKILTLSNIETEELTKWADQAGLNSDKTVFIGLRNGFQIQVRKFIKTEQNN